MVSISSSPVADSSLPSRAGARARVGARAVVVLLALLAAPLLASPLGRLRDPLALVLVLPPMAASLDALGWSETAAVAIRRVRRPLARVAVAYAVWLITSALLTLDVAAVAAGSVGLRVAGTHESERDAQIGAGVVGSNVGSLLFPFSNLTNLVLLAGTGIGFGAYVRAALWPQLATAVAAGVVLLWRARRRLARPGARPGQDDGRATAPASTIALEPHARLGGLIVVAGSVAAIAAGFAGGDIAAVLAVTASIVAAITVHGGSATSGRLVRSIPLAGVGVILAAAALGGPMATLAGILPMPGPTTPSPLALTSVALVGGLLSAGLNNLPAAAFGAVWLRTADPALVLAYLIGTNVLALVTPHGSLATLLCRSAATREGHALGRGPYVAAAWRFALAGSLAALAALVTLG